MNYLKTLFLRVALWVLLGMLIRIPITNFVVEAFRIPTGSMENTLLIGDFLLANKFAYDFRDPKRGDILTFHPPTDPAKSYVKRLVGLGGDTLEMRNKILFINEKQFFEPYVRYEEPTHDAVYPGMNWQSNYLLASPAHDYHPSRDNWGPIIVPPRKYFVLGDNRDNSEDSRFWGFITKPAITGTPVVVYFSRDMESGHIRWKRIWHRIE
jgi:signal peptidase I